MIPNLSAPELPWGEGWGEGAFNPNWPRNDTCYISYKVRRLGVLKLESQ